MSRSHQHNSRTGITTARSEKQFKQSCNRILRRAHKMTIKAANLRDELGDFILPSHPREVVETYTGPKDGKQWFDADKYPELMRK
jgi:hypothetical protein